MSSQRVPLFIAAICFLLAACAGLYRLMVGFEIVIGNTHVGHTATFFEFVITAALALIFFRAAMVGPERRH
jgi:hypothetical protein